LENNSNELKRVRLKIWNWVDEGGEELTWEGDGFELGGKPRRILASLASICVSDTHTTRRCQWL